MKKYAVNVTLFIEAEDEDQADHRAFTVVNFAADVTMPG